MSTHIKPADVKMTFAAAEWTKSKPSGEVKFKCRTREALYDSCKWSLQFVPVEKLYIAWPMGMGFRKWARGWAVNVAVRFLLYRDDPIWKFSDAILDIPHGCMGQIMDGAYPIIVIKRGKRLEIDDGCHRAIAKIMANAKTIQAYVGIPRRK